MERKPTTYFCVVLRENFLILFHQIKETFIGGRFSRRSRITILSLFFCLINLYGGTVYSLGITGTVEGNVRDKTTGQPLAGVNIIISNTMYGSSTDANGEYRIINVRAGVYRLVISMIGYTSVIVMEVQVLPDLRTRIDVELEPAAIQLDAVYITAERPLIQRDLPATVYSIGRIKLDKLPVSTVSQVLALQPGTTVEGNVRGGKTTEVVYLIDGIPVQDAIVGGLAFNLPKSSVSGLTIHTGGFEAEYGNALSGVVNIITRGGSDNHFIDTRLERDSWIPSKWNKQQNHHNEFELTAGGPLKKGSTYYYTAQLLNGNDTRYWQDFRHFFDSPVSKEFSGYNKIEHHLSSRMKISVHNLYSFKRWQDYEFSWRFNLDGLPKRATESHRIALAWSHSVSSTSFYSVTFSRSTHHSKLNNRYTSDIEIRPYRYDFFLRYITEGSRNWWGDTRQIIYTVKGDYTAHIAQRHIMKFGIEFNQYDLNSHLIKYEPQLTYFGKPVETAPLLNFSNQYNYHPRSGSVYLQDKIELVRDGTNLSFGLRWDFLDPTAQRPIVEFIPVSSDEYDQQITGYTPASFKHQVSPRISLAAPVGENTFFFLNFGHYFQFPVFDVLYSGINPIQIREGTKNVLTGNPDLEPERTVAWEGGFKYGVTKDLLFSIAMFKKSFTNQIDSRTLIPFDSKSAGDFGFGGYVNHAEASASGLEILIHHETSDGFQRTLSYSFMSTEGVSEYVDQQINHAQWGFPLIVRPYPLSWDQRHTIKADVEFALFGDVIVNLIALYNSPRPYTYYPTRDGFTPLDTTKSFLPNNARMESNIFLNAKLYYDFDYFKNPDVKISLYLDMRNFINRKNVRWIDSSGKIGGELNDPGAYYDPRRISAGIRVRF